MHQLLLSQWGNSFEFLSWNFRSRVLKKILQLATYSRQKDETLKMMYMRFFKLKEDTHSITSNLEATHRYLRSLEGPLTLHAQVLQRVFV
jgi:hypothetical protein